MIWRVAFVGRSNVGKSSLFNRIAGQKKALVLNKPGVTRDVKKELIELEGVSIELADLAGLELDALGSKDSQNTSFELLQKLSTKAALEYLKSSHVVLFILDARSGLNPEDEVVSRLLRKNGVKNVIPVLAKAEHILGAADDTYEDMGLRLGWGESYPTSAEHNRGVETLKDVLIAKIAELSKVEEAKNLEIKPENSKAPEEEAPGDVLRFGVYGRPNVGKSTLVNAILGESRMIVSHVAGTTIDTVDSEFSRDGKLFRIMDTAGIRRKSKTEVGVEVLSVVQALASLEKVHVALFVIDGFEGITDQDEKIASAIKTSGRGCIIIVNKWDLCDRTQESYAEQIQEEMAFLDYAPIVFMSAQKRGRRLNAEIEQVLSLALDIRDARMKLVKTAELNRVLRTCEMRNNPKDAKFFYALQTSKNPPTISIKVNDPKKVDTSLQRYLTRSLRSHFGWIGSPVRLVFQKKAKNAFIEKSGSRR